MRAAIENLPVTSVGVRGSRRLMGMFHLPNRLVSRRVACLLFVVTFVAIAVGVCPVDALAQDAPAPTLPSLDRGPGGYLSLVKIGLIAAVFLVWIRMVDWINRDSIKLLRRLQMDPVVWNPILVGSFLIGFLCAISVPMFLVGYPIFVVAALVPPLAYFLTRRSKIAESPSVARALAAGDGEEADIEALPQDDGVEVDFSPAGADKRQQQSNLIKARQSTGFVDAKQLLHDAMFKRAEQLMLDFGREQVKSRMFVDGVWHPLEPREREVGDAMLVSLKAVAGLNPADRRSRQDGSFGIKTDLGKANLKLMSQGIKTGERINIRFVAKAKDPLTLAEAGMFPEMAEKIKSSVNGTGLVIVSAPAGAGLTTSWQAVVASSDRLTRDCVALIDPSETDTRIENIVINEADASSPEAQAAALKKLLLAQPDGLIAPEIADGTIMDTLTLQTQDERSVLTRTKAKSASEALLRVYAKAGNRDQFANAAAFATCQRLIRRLCDDCKQKVKTPPKTIQQLGGNPKKQNWLYTHWRLPPPDQRVDEKGRDIEFPPCETCGGLGYIGQIAVFELLEVNDAVRATLKSQPKIDAIEQVARKSGKASISQQTYKLVLLGVTSLAEAQRMLKADK